MTERATPTTQELRSILMRWSLVLFACGLFAVWATWRLSGAAERLPSQGTTSTTKSLEEREVEYWTCSMHPQVRESHAGKCPICGMELVPQYEGNEEIGLQPASSSSLMQTGGHEHSENAEETSPDQAWYRCTMPECGDQGSSDPNSRCPVCGMKRERIDTGGNGTGSFEIKLSDRARRLAEVETEPVRERLLFRRIRTVGRIAYDETRYKMVSAWVGGRIDRLFADFTGMHVTKGDHLVEIYSPELLSSQEEYLQALRATRPQAGASGTLTRRNGDQLLDAARRKLELLGITDDQIAAIERSGQPLMHLVIYAPLGGTVLAKQAMEGMYVKTGDPLYTIADLRNLWLLVDLYEPDLPWVKPFQQVRVTTRSLPGETFTGEIFFVDPSVDPKTRTVDVRIHVDNPDLRLKPGMWVTAEIEAALGPDGEGTIPAPRGAYACPMHPWETADEPGPCPLCQMTMVPVGELPQYSKPTSPFPVLSAPRDAVMQTGERALVYVETAPATYRGVEVTLGPLAQAEDGEGYYPIFSGLRSGEPVVTRGNFAIDSQMQLAGKPSLFTVRGFAVDDSDPMKARGESAPVGQSSAGQSAIVQTHCPVMGGEIDPTVFIDYKGAKIYFCCWGCDEKFRAEPEKYIPKLPESIQKQIRDADSRDTEKQTLCPVMGGEIDPKVYTDFHGVRIYFCCPPCIDKFTSEPEKYIDNLPKTVAEKIRQSRSHGG
ncbi:MAG: efflux RND transporter periplasmic adaptor subunit [Phycisphaerae bacterium]|nr:efflux RND transporter periplasmic adaptor subunit [Phycisphaerae bacterium]